MIYTENIYLKLCILIVVLAAATSNYAQSICTEGTSTANLNFNKVSATIHNGGDLWNVYLQNGKYEVPKNSGILSIIGGGLWIGGIDNGGQLRLAAQQFRQHGNDYFPGPGGYGNFCETFDRHWEVVRTDIQQQINNYNIYGNNIPSSEIPNVIKEWPAKGNSISRSTFNGDETMTIIEDMTPFIDMNNNGLYEPEKGDYPDVPGDQAIWTVFNDYLHPHTETGGMALNIDVHLLAYAFNSPGIIDYTTFYKYKIINKGHDTINKIHIGQWVEVDVGYGFDDYIGCDTVRNMGIGYNGDAIDGPATLSYGSNPPLVGVKFLQTPINDQGVRPGMTSFMYYYNDFSSNMGIPEIPEHYYNYMTNKWKDGTLRTYGGTGYGLGTPTNFMYPGKPGLGDWSECDEGNNTGDRRMVMSTGPFTFNPNQIIELDFAVLWKRCNGQTGCMADFDCFGIDANYVQIFFDNIISSNIEEPHIKKGQINVYPNPAKDVVNIDFGSNDFQNNLVVEIRDISGKKLNYYIVKDHNFQINTADISPGLYFITVLNDNIVISNQKIIIQ